MIKEKRDKLDELIQNVISEELDSIDISYEEIELEWSKLKQKMHKRPRRIKYNRTNKIVAVILGTVISVGLLGQVMDNETVAWKRNLKDVVKIFENKKTINNTSTIKSEKGNSSDETYENAPMNMSIEEARDIVNFNFKTLPYKEQNLIIKQITENDYKVELNYIDDKGKIRLIQFPEGDEYKENINVPKESIIEKFKINNITYTIVKIGDKKSKVLWSYYGIRNILDIKYSIKKEEVVEMIKGMK